MAAAFRLLADPTRLRLLRLVAREELAAGELTQIVEAGQSTVSRHLAMLREAGLVQERREGRFVFFSLAPEATRPEGPWAGAVQRLTGAEDAHGDLARLADVLRARREDSGAGAEGAAKPQFVPGRSWAAWAQALAWLVPPGLRAADLGCGDGALTLEIARFAAEVVGVDRNAALVAKAAALAQSRGVANAKFVKGDVCALKFGDASFDLAVMSQALHCIEEPSKALAEAARVLAPLGRLVVLELLPHDHEWVREKLGHRHLGFAPERLAEMIRAAGFGDVEVERVAPRARDEFRVLLAAGVKAARPTGRRRASR